MTRLFPKPPWFQLVPVGLYHIPTAEPLLHYLGLCLTPFPPVYSPLRNFTSTFSWEKKGSGQSSIVLQDWSGTLILSAREQNAWSKVLRARQLLVLSQRVEWTRIHTKALSF